MEAAGEHFMDGGVKTQPEAHICKETPSGCFIQSAEINAGEWAWALGLSEIFKAFSICINYCPFCGGKLNAI